MGIKKRKIKPSYLACVWCGKPIPENKPYVKYCSKKCERESKGYKVFMKDIIENKKYDLGMDFIPYRNYSFQEEKLKGREIMGLILLTIILILAMIVGGQTYPY